MFISNIKEKIFLVISVVLIIMIFLDIAISFYNFSFYPTILCYSIFFIEFFCLFSNFSELFIYLTNSQVYTLKFKIGKLFIELLDTIIFTAYCFSKKNQNNLEIISKNLFNKDLRNFNPNDIYYYIETYIKYSKNKNMNYMDIFRIIQTHILKCNNRECPCRLLIQKSILYSIFTNFSNIRIKERIDSINSNKEEKNYENDINNKKLSETNIVKSNEINNIEENKSNKGSKVNTKSLIADKEHRKSNIKNDDIEKIEDKNFKKSGLYKKKTLAKNLHTFKSKTILCL